MHIYNILYTNKSCNKYMYNTRTVITTIYNTKSPS